VNIKCGYFRDRLIDYRLVKDTREVLGSNLSRDTGYSEIIRGFLTPFRIFSNPF
jgi:hypothetical protein